MRTPSPVTITLKMTMNGEPLPTDPPLLRDYISSTERKVRAPRLYRINRGSIQTKKASLAVCHTAAYRSLSVCDITNWVFRVQRLIGPVMTRSFASTSFAHGNVALRLIVDDIAGDTQAKGYQSDVSARLRCFKSAKDPCRSVVGKTEPRTVGY
jgi:hypothetical protein